MTLRSYFRVLISLAVCVPLQLIAQPVQDLLSGMRDQREAVRITSFYTLMGSSNNRVHKLRVDLATKAALARNNGARAEIAHALISLLESENARVRSAAIGSMTEGYGEFHGDLIWSVGTLVDPSAVKALAGALGTGGLAVRGLAALGVSSIDALAEGATSPQLLIRFDAIAALGVVAKDHDTLGVEPADMTRIAAVLQKSATFDQSADIRIEAIDGLTPFTDAKTEAVISQIALRDTSFVVRSGRRVFLVRDKADSSMRSRGRKKKR